MSINKLIGVKAVLLCIAAASLTGCSAMGNASLGSVLYPDNGMQGETPSGFGSTDGIPHGIAKYFDQIRIVRNTSPDSVLIVPQSNQ